MYTLKTIAKRSTALGMAASLMVATMIPAASVFAQQALNPLTERSLLLSSSAPGYIDTDGSGNSFAAPNAGGGHYAPAGSGPNGKKTGQTFTFRASSTSEDISRITLQYCTVAAGLCQAPGNNAGDARLSGDDDRLDNVEGHAAGTSDFDIVGEFAEGSSSFNYTPGAPIGSPTNGGGTFEVFVGEEVIEIEDEDDQIVPRSNSGWSFATTTDEDEDWTGDGGLTGKNNFITLQRGAEDATTINNGDIVRVVFRPNESVYMTNPGDDEFFVKINTFDSTGAVVNGGVTVANVMTDSIHISTKVLETMSFSVGTANPDMRVLGGPSDHGTCDPITVNERLQLGELSSEFSLSARTAYDANSYWRLSSNSSGGATVYYSGYTLSNTVADEIADMPTKANSLPGTEQFGLGFVDVTEDGVSTSFQAAVDAENSRYRLPNSFPFKTVTAQTLPDYADTRFVPLAPQPISGNYADATGTLQTSEGVGAGTAQFRFAKTSLTVPEPIARQNETVISCATAKMRYVANIGADTPAGVYTTKVNYLAAPQY